MGKYLTAAIAIGGVDPSIQTPLESVQAMLLVAGVEPAEENLCFVGATVAVRVLGIE